MANNYFKFKQFAVYQERSAFKVGTDGVLLGACAEVEGKQKILDIGTGTGLIALMIAQRCEAAIDAVEPDQGSFQDAVENVRSSPWSGRIVVHNCTIGDFVPANVKYDLIVSNPPYFIDSLKNPDPVKSRTRHNVTLTHSEILKSVYKLLDEHGTFQLIMPFAEGNIFIAEASDYGFYCNNILKIKPTASSDVRRIIITFSRKRDKPNERFLTIEKGRRHEFTEEYISLTKDFYLKF